MKRFGERTAASTAQGNSATSPSNLFIRRSEYDIVDVEKVREEVRRRREADLERDARALRDKSPEETLRMFFDMCEFVQKFGRVSA